MFFDLEPLLWLNCARHSVTGQTPRHFIPQKKQRQGWRVISWQTKLASFRQKTCGIKCHGGGLSRFPGFRFRSSLLTSLRWPATPPFQSGLGSICIRRLQKRRTFLSCRQRRNPSHAGKKLYSGQHRRLYKKSSFINIIFAPQTFS